MAMILGTDANNNLTGTTSGDTIVGAGGNDKVNAGAGNDLVDGGAGNDKIDGGLGDDTLLGGSGNDNIDDNSGANLIYGGSGNDDIKLKAGLGSIIYGDGYNGFTLTGPVLELTSLSTTLGNDKIDGSSGADVIYGDNGNNLSGNGIGGDDDIDGGAGNDLVYGEGGKDDIRGGDGDDTLIGGAGGDKLAGGSGRDRFVYQNTFESTTSALDRISDFTIGQDKFDLTAMLAGGLVWSGATAALNSVWVTQSGGNTFVRANVNGNTDFGVQLNGLRNLAASDFLGLASTANQAPLLTGAPAVLMAGAEDTPYTILASALLQGYTDPNGDTLTVSGLMATNGVLTATATGWTFAPSPNYNGAVNLSYNVVDGNGGSVAAARSFNLAPVNDAVTGIATAVLLDGTEDTAYQVTAAELLQGFSDVDSATNGQLLSIAGAVTATNGTVSYNAGTASYTITPVANFAGPVELNYLVTDGNGSSVAASLALSLNADADTPVLNPGANAASQGNGAIGLGISAALSDLDGSESLSIAIAGVPAGWVLSAGVLNEETGTYLLTGPQLAALTITPPPGTSGEISLSVTATATEAANGDAASQTSSLKISVTQLGELQGQAIDGYIVGATVFADADADGVLDTTEARATTDASGNFTLVGGSGSLVMFGGTDVSTGLAFQGFLRAPAGSTVVTPLTTLVQALAGPGATQVAIDAAAAQVASAFGIAPGLNLLSFDPVAAIVAGAGNAAAAEQVLAAGIQVQNAIVQIGALLTGAGATNAGQAVVTELANLVAAAGAGTVNLASAGVVGGLIDAAAVTADGVAPADVGAVVGDAASVLAAANTAINEAVILGSGTGLLTELAQVAVVAQSSSVTDDLAAAGVANSAGTLTTDYTGPALDTLVGLAAAAVGDVDGGLNGTLGNDTLSGGTGNDAVAGLEGNDLLIGLAGNDTLLGGAGNDTMRGGAGNDLLNGGFIVQYLTPADWSDTDRADYSDTTQQVVVNLATGIAAGAEIGTDQLIGIEEVAGGSGNDSLTGSGNFFESFIGGAGNDAINGAGGNDRAVYADATGAVSANLGSGNANAPSAVGSVTGDLSVGADALLDVEQIRGTSYGDSFVAAGFASLTQPGGVASTFNSFEGLGGNDTITGNGNTRADYLSATGAVNVDLIAATPTIGGSSGSASGGGVGIDTILGGVNNVRGSAYADNFTGGSATSGQSWEGRGGADLIDGGSGFDTARYAFDGPISVGLTINMAAGTVTGDPLYTGVDTLRNVEGIQGSILGDTYDARGYGAAGAQNVSSGVGAFGTFNSFEGMNGNDTIYGNGDTQIEFFNAREGVAVDLAAGSVAGGASVGTDTIMGGVVRVIGSAFDDVITGINNSGPSTVNTVFEIFQGRGGNDIIDSNGGFDQVRYNEGAQATHVFNASLLASAPTLNGIYLSVKGASLVDATTFIVVGNPVTVGIDELINISQIRGSVFSDFFDARGYSPDTGFGNGAFVEFQGDGGDDYFWGNGITRVSYSAAGSAVTVTLTAGGTGSASGASTGVDTFLGGVDLVRGSDFNDMLIGSSSGNSFQGRSGDDTIRGGGGDDRIEGQGGTDLIDFSDATAAINFTLNQGSNGGSLWSSGALGGGLGTDSYRDIEGVIGSAFNDNLTGSSGNDALYAGSGDDVLNGGDGNDSLYGQQGSDFFVSGAGNDTLDGGVVLDPFFGSDLNTVSYSGATAGVNLNLSGISGNGSVGSGTVSGDASVGSDTLMNISLIRGSGFADTMLGSTALIFEQFEGGAGNDTIDGGVITDSLNGDNTNRLMYQNTQGAGVTVDFLAGTAVGAAGSDAGNDTISNFNSVRGSSFADALYGTARADNLLEDFEGRNGDDYIDGRGGLDRVRYDTAGGAVTASLVSGTATSIGANNAASIGNDTFFNIEQLSGSRFNDSLTGGNAANGTSIADYLVAGLNEGFRGNGGNDTIDGGQGMDFAIFNNATVGVTVVLNDTLDGWAMDGQGGTDVLRGIEGVSGGQFNDTLTGSDTGEFEAFGGREGSDTIDGKGGRDRADYFASRAGINVVLGNGGADGTASDGYGSTDILRNIEDVRGSRDFNDSITGNELNNTLDALGGNDSLDGGNGNDTLAGGRGNDSLVGGSGADTFVWNLGDGGVVGTPATDIVADFLAGDVIDLRGLLVGESHVGNDPGNLVNYLQFSYDGSNTIIQVDSDGSLKGLGIDQTITLVGYNHGTVSASILQYMLSSGDLFTN